jgi:hypothetical protein
MDIHCHNTLPDQRDLFLHHSEKLKSIVGGVLDGKRLCVIIFDNAQIYGCQSLIEIYHQ